MTVAVTHDRPVPLRVGDMTVKQLHRYREVVFPASMARQYVAGPLTGLGSTFRPRSGAVRSVREHLRARAPFLSIERCEDWVTECGMKIFAALYLDGGARGGATNSSVENGLDEEIPRDFESLNDLELYLYVMVNVQIEAEENMRNMRGHCATMREILACYRDYILPGGNLDGPSPNVEAQPNQMLSWHPFFKLSNACMWVRERPFGIYVREMWSGVDIVHDPEEDSDESDTEGDSEGEDDEWKDDTDVDFEDEDAYAYNQDNEDESDYSEDQMLQDPIHCFFESIKENLVPGPAEKTIWPKSDADMQVDAIFETFFQQHGYPDELCV